MTVPDFRSLMRPLALLVLIMLIWPVGAREAGAHPHAWVDVRSAPVFDAEGQLIAIEQEWFFDYFYSAFVREELDGDGGVTQEGLDQIAAENIDELEQFGYFTDVRSGEQAVVLDEPHDVATGFQGERLWLRFVLPLAQPADAHDGALSYAIYDPTYYVEMLHLRDEPIMLLGEGSEICKAWIVAPNPTADAVALSSSLGIDETPEFALGAVFAEWVHVACP